MTQHTPGPWSLDKHTNCDIVAANGTLEIATTHEALLTGGYRDPATAQADAKLIAAAPELLALVIQYRDDLKRPPHGDSLYRRMEAIEAAIAKAVQS